MELLFLPLMILDCGYAAIPYISELGFRKMQVSEIRMIYPVRVSVCFFRLFVQWKFYM